VIECNIVSLDNDGDIINGAIAPELSEALPSASSGRPSGTKIASESTKAQVAFVKPRLSVRSSRRFHTATHK